MSALAYHRLPRGWEVRPLKRIAALNPEVLPEDTDPEWTFPYVDIGNVTFEAGITGNALVRFADAPSRARRRVRNGDTIVSTVRTYLRAIAPVWNQPDDLIVSTGFAVIRARPPMDAGYLSWALRSNTFVESVVAESVGVSYPAIAPSVLGSLSVPMPPPAEQRAIADFLDRETAKIDALIATQERLIALLDEKRQATITHAVTKGLDPDAPMKESGDRFVGEIPEHWGLIALRHLLSHPLAYGANEAGDQSDRDDPRFVRITDISSDGSLRYETFRSLPMEIAKPFLLRDGDLLLARSGATVGKSFIYDQSWGQCCFAGYLIRARCNSALLASRLLHFFLASSAYWNWVNSNLIQATIQNISADRYAGLKVPVPPRGEQGAIIRHLDHVLPKIDHLRNRSETVIEHLRERRTALITAAVIGQIDVTNPAITEAAE